MAEGRRQRTDRFVSAEPPRIQLQYDPAAEVKPLVHDTAFCFGPSHGELETTPPWISDFAPPGGVSMEEEFQRGSDEDKDQWSYVTEQRASATEEGHEGMSLDDFCAHPEAVQANLTRDEVIALRLYTGPSYTSINGSLRRSEHTFSSTVRHICYGIAKLSQHAPQQILYRGVRGDLPPHMSAYTTMDSVVTAAPAGCTTEDQHITTTPGGGIEAAFSSTTASLEVALSFGSDVIFEFDGKGGPLKWVSQFPEEEEFLLAAGTTFQIHEGDNQPGLVEELGRELDTTVYHCETYLVRQRHKVKTRSVQSAAGDVTGAVLRVRPVPPTYQDREVKVPETVEERFIDAMAKKYDLFIDQKSTALPFHLSHPVWRKPSRDFEWPEVLQLGELFLGITLDGGSWRAAVAKQSRYAGCTPLYAAKATAAADDLPIPVVRQQWGTYLEGTGLTDDSVATLMDKMFKNQNWVLWDAYA